MSPQKSVSDALQIWGTVPQGTTLGVFLFILMINDLCTNVPTFKYVDDTTIYNISNDPSNTECQSAMNKIIKWSGQNKMKINAKKTKEMLITFMKNPSSIPNIVVDGKPLERVDCVTLLGLRITNTLSWQTHIDYVDN